MHMVAQNCTHVGQGNLDAYARVLQRKKLFAKCNDCDDEGPNLWVCLHPECMYVGCSQTNYDHSTSHNYALPSHAFYVNMSTHKIWCYVCNRDVVVRHVVSPSTSPEHKPRVDPPAAGDNHNDDNFRQLMLLNDGKFDEETNLTSMEPFRDSLVTLYKQRTHAIIQSIVDEMNDDKLNNVYNDKSDSPGSTDSEDGQDFTGKPRGLVGLQNIGNTCYMNAALQALSNVPPLTQFFLDCDHMVEYIAKDRKPGLSISYLNVIKDMWNKKTRGYVAPHYILTGIRTVHPMFRGYHQHDTQEFLRCFMDQLHEELKEQLEIDRDSVLRSKGIVEHSSDEEENEMEGTGSSQSDGEYETCDSGVSERSSLSDEGERGTKRRYSKVSQSEKLRTKFSNRSGKKSATEEGSYSYTESPLMPQRSSQNSPVKHRSKRQIKTRSIISDIFDGKLLSSVQCLTCDRVSTRIETFQDLSLPIPSRDHIDMLHQGSLTPQIVGPCPDGYAPNQSGWFTWLMKWLRSWFLGPVVSLHDCLSAFFSADELKGDNMYSCEKCNKLRNGVKFSKVLELPEILCIHLKRFRHELMINSKMSNYVSFPLTGLDMRLYLHKECVSKVTTYDLISVICHHGTAGGGHYTCYALNAISNQWFEFDDQCVTRVLPETVKNCEAYVLFYKKRSPEMMQLREKTSELMEHVRLSSREFSDMKFFVSKQWINRFNTFSEPGPIDNSDFLCPHGGVNPARRQLVDKISMPIPQPIWEYLYQTFGGGPACTQLYECPVCEENYESLQNRRQYEQDKFHTFTHNLDNRSAIYALAMAWFRQWQSFVRGRETQPPGPVDNSSIATIKNGQTVLKAGSDYSQIPEDLWQFYYSTYGGGPELLLHSCQRPSQPSVSVHSTSSPNLIDSSKTNHVESKVTKMQSVSTSSVNKGSDTSSQDSGVDNMNPAVYKMLMDKYKLGSGINQPPGPN